MTEVVEDTAVLEVIVTLPLVTDWTVPEDVEVLAELEKLLGADIPEDGDEIVPERGGFSVPGIPADCVGIPGESEDEVVDVTAEEEGGPVNEGVSAELNDDESDGRDDREAASDWDVVRTDVSDALFDHELGAATSELEGTS